MLAPSKDTARPPQLYLADAGPPPNTAPLSGSLDADVVVIGAGFTGLSAALHLAEAGRKPVLIEAQDIAWGASGRNFGQVVPYTKHSESHVLKTFGPVHGPRLIEATGKAPGLVFDLIEKHGIACSVRRNGLLFAANSEAGLHGLQTRSLFWQERGAPVEMLSRGATASAIGSELYPAAMLDRRGGTLNPVAYAQGLAAAAIRHGATIHTQTRVTGLSPAGSGWTITTAAGSVTAATVVVASDAYTDGFAPQIRKSLIPMRAYQLVSEPLSDNLRATILPQGHALTDTRRLFSGIRLHRDGRLQIGLDGPVFSDGQPYIDKATQRVQRLFPQIGAINWQECWSGWVSMTANHYPQLVRLAPNCLGALGYSGRGIALATLCGHELARHITGTPDTELALPMGVPKPIAVRPFAAPMVGGLMTLYRALDDADDRRLSRAM
ncbi:FAD-binding oxidoreductase [Acidisphaera sp. L21]|uniref:NAD(P)/FAD-dependent oxidoreductase n=1 Tax=Acidisphaera sp. L21 TaxID=1641851 RepID=UPI00131DFE0F|nr:FAD-binding oxidoreductase [Acidisphaera sp. L21]